MQRAQRIAFVCPRYAGGSTLGGAETLLRNLARSLVRHGHEVEYLTTCATDHFTWANALPAGARTEEGVTIRFFPVDDARDVRAFLRVQARISAGAHVTPEEEATWFDNGVQSTPLIRHLSEQGRTYDRIIVGPYLFGLVGRAAAVHPDRTLLLPCLHDEPFARLAGIDRLFGLVRGVLFNTESERRLAHRLYPGRTRPEAVVGMGIDPFPMEPGVFARRRGIAQPYLLYSGRREPLKGTPLLLDYLSAFRQRTERRIPLVMTGSGPFDRPPAIAADIVDLGFVTEEEKHAAMADAHVFCHPSRNESFGIVILEAWLAGTPALVSAASDVLTEHCRVSRGGLWFRNYPEFEESLLWMLESPKDAKAMGRAGLEYVRDRYSRESVDRRLLAALDGL